jgi:hypothetical protein
MYLITLGQLRHLRDFADELTRMAASEDQVGSPPAYYLKQIDKAIPEMVQRYLAVLSTIEGQPADLKARF